MTAAQDIDESLGPIPPGSSEPAGAASEASPPAQGIASEARPARILVVDDQPANIQILGGILGAQGHEIVPASDGATALKRIAEFRADALIVSLGVDTFADDPISFFRLQSADFLTYGQLLGACNLPTLFVLEGGYAVEAIGVNVVNVLMGFEASGA